MRPAIVQLVLSYGAGLWAGLVFLVPAGSIWVLLVCSVIGLLWRRWGGLILAAIFLGAAVGGTKAVELEGTCGAVWGRGRYTAIVHLHDRPGRNGTATATVAHSHQACGGDLRLRVDAPNVLGGSRLLVVGLHRGRGVFRVDHHRVLRGNRHWRFVIRDAVGQRVVALYGRRSGIVEALVLGRRTDVDPALRQRFVDAGLAHVLAISGLHVGVLATWISLMVRFVVGSRTAWLASSAVIWCYVGLLGFPAAATRAAAFISVYGCARVRQRHPPIGAVLAVAMFLVLANDPAAATSVGAWLSAAAVLGTRLGANALPRLRLLGASLGATVLTAPITAYVFGAVAPIGVIANLAAIPAAAVAVPGLFLSLCFGSIPAGGTGVVLAGLEWIAARGAEVPGGHFAGAAGARFAGPWLVLLATVLWLKARRPSVRRIKLSVLFGSVLACWWFLLAAVTAPRYRANEVVIHFVSVGQGDAAVIRTPGGTWALVDGGPRVPGFDAGRRFVVPFLRRNGVRELGAVVVSHGDADHLGGVPAVVKEVPPRLVLDPGEPLPTSLYLEYLEELDRVGVEWRAARAGDVLRIDSIRLEVLHPRQDWISTHLEPNNNSVVLRLEYGCFSALFAGDIEWPAESLLIPTIDRADLLKVGHHGAGGGTTDAWLDAIQPRAAVISVGRNRYGHPASTTLERLFARNVLVRRTDEGGTVTVRSDGRYFQLTQGVITNPWEALKCLIQRSLRSSGSSSSKRSCTPTPPVSLPSCSTT